MESEQHSWSHMFAELSSLDDLYSPLKRSSRLKYNCLSVSQKLIAVGSNTGGIYVFSRDSLKLLQVVFANKETSSVSMVRLSPNDKFAAFTVSTGAIHVMDLKTETRSKPESVCHVPDLEGAMVTSLHWDKTSTRLYVGDDMGKVAVIHTSKAMNLFGIPLEVIMKLDSAVVQLDKAEDKLLVSTHSRSYLCDTVKQQFSQIGKKPRDGQYGACFYPTNKVTPTIYCARPGSRIWEVDFDGNVLNTHQFRQLLAVPALPVLTCEGCPELPDEKSVSQPQSVNFPRLKILSGSYLLSWSQNCIYVFDPVTVKVILWCNKYRGIEDVRCLGNEVYVCLHNMEVHCIQLLPAIRVISLPLSSGNWQVAAMLCVFFQHNLLTNSPRKLVKIENIQKLHNEMLKSDNLDLAQKLHSLILKLEACTTSSSDAESSDTSRSRSNSTQSSGSVTSHSLLYPGKPAVLEVGNHADMNSNFTGSQMEVQGKSQLASDQSRDSRSQMRKESEGFDSAAEITVSMATRNVSPGPGVVAKEGSAKMTDNKKMVADHGDGVSDASDKTGVMKSNSRNDFDEIDLTLSDNPPENLTNPSSGSLLPLENGYSEAAGKDLLVPQSRAGSQSSDIPLHSASASHGKVQQERTSTHSLSDKATSVPSSTKEPSLSVSMPTPNDKTPTAVVDVRGAEKGDEVDEEAEIVASYQSSNHGSRRPSTASLSSLSSCEVNLEQPVMTGKVFPQSSEQIAVPMKRRLKKKKKSLDETSENGDRKRKSGRVKRSQSVGAIQVPVRRDLQASPQGSLKDAIEEDCVPASHADEQSQSRLKRFEAQSAPTAAMATTQSRSVPNSLLTEERSDDSYSTSQYSVLSESGEFSNLYDMAPGDSPFNQWDGSLGSPSPKMALLQLRDRFQTKLTSKTKQLFQNIKEKKNILSRSAPREDLGQATDASDVGRFDLTIEVTDATDGAAPVVPVSPVDLTDLQECTEKTKQALQDLEILTDPGTVQRILLHWVTALNKTFKKLHLTQVSDMNSMNKETFEADTGDKNAETQSTLASVANGNHEHEQADLEQDRTTNEGESDHSSAVHETDSVSSETTILPDLAEHQLGDGSPLETSVLPTGVESRAIEEKESAGVLLDSEQRCQQSNQSNTNIDTAFNDLLSDKDFCYTKDPLFLNSDLFVSVSELAQACFDLSCHGDILDYKNLNFPGNSLKQGKKNMSSELLEGDTAVGESCIHVSHNNSVITEENHVITGSNHSDGSGVEGQGQANAEKLVPNVMGNDDLQEGSAVISKLASNDMNIRSDLGADIGSSHRDTDISTNCDISSENSNQKNTSGEEEPSDFIPQMCKTCAITEATGENESHIETEGQSQGRPEDSLDAHMAFFVRCYFPYLSISRIREAVLDTRGCHYQMWSALTTCLKACAQEDGDRYGVEGGALLAQILDKQMQDLTEDGTHKALLGHVARIFRDDLAKTVTACVQCHPYVQPLDVLYLSQMSDVPVNNVFKPYMFRRLQDASRTHRPESVRRLCDHQDVLHSWLECLLLIPDHGRAVRDSAGNPRVFSNRLSWKHEKAIIELLDRYPTESVLEVCARHGYWRGCLKLLKHFGRHGDQAAMVLSLGDIKLLSNTDPCGYLPDSREEWKQFLVSFSHHDNQSLSETLEENQSQVEACSDWSDRITWDSLAVLLVRQLGPAPAVSLLQECEVTEGSLSTAFYQVGLLAGMVKKHQRLVLHAMLEKIDSYLWSQRPSMMSPMLQYAVVNEKQMVARDSNTSQPELVQVLFSDLHDAKTNARQVAEDPECHWGVETRINILCPCCSVPLKESVSHGEPGVLLFRCGHGYHKLCLPDRECLLCLEAGAETAGNT